MFKKIIALLLTLCTLLSAFSMTSCKKEDGSDGSMVFKGFNVWEQDFSPIRILNQFGKISLNLTEKEYVKFGAGSAKIQPSGGTFETAKPTFIIPTYSTFLGYDYGDFTKTEKISVWVYNVQENKEWIGMGLQTGPWKTGQWWDSVVRTNTMYFTLNHGWNYIEYDIDPTYLEMQSQFDIKNVLGVFFEFDYHDQFKDQIPVFYMDDLRFHYSESAVKGSTYELKSDAVAGVWEVADFEDKKQNLFTYQRTSDGSLIRMNARVINGSEQNVTAKSGTNVLEVTKHAGENNGGWPQLILSYKVFEKAFANIGSDIAEHPENYYICLEFYYPQL